MRKEPKASLFLSRLLGRNGIILLCLLCDPISSFSIVSFTSCGPHPAAARSKGHFALTGEADTLTAPNTSVEVEPNNQIPYNWKDNWYALTYVHHVPDPSKSAEPTAAAVFGHPLVLWRSQDGGPISCADDLCPHRSAALTEGRVRDGRIECLYHGWQFRGVEGEGDPSKGGSCALIPQLQTGGTIPKRACLKMREVRESEGVVWVWMGDDDPKYGPPKTGDDLDERGQKEGAIGSMFQIDLPYDHSYLVENLLDPAHIPISHDRTSGGGRREDAQPFEMEVDEESFSPRGFTGRYRRAGANAEPDAPFTEIRFDAPGIVRMRFSGGKVSFGAALHCMPVGLGRSRLLFLTYFTGLPWLPSLIIKSKPNWLRALNSCKVLEQDVGLITTQEDHFARSPHRSMKQDFLLLDSSDKFVGAYRRWLDRVGHGMPWFQGLSRSSSNVSAHLNPSATLTPSMDPANHRASNQNVKETRYHRHVIQCPETKEALRKIVRIKTGVLAAATLAISGAICLAPTIAGTATEGISRKVAILRRLFRLLALSAPLLTWGGAWLHGLEQRFYVSFKRREQLMLEKGT